jgi:putative transposase
LRTNGKGVFQNARGREILTRETRAKGGAIEQNGSESRREWLLREFETAADANKQYSKYHLWQYTSHPIPIESWEVAIQKQQYIHQNPVRAGIVNEASAYIYSSACVDSPLKTLEL